MTVKLLLFTVNLVILISLVQNKFILKQVVILNRHGLRTPLSNNFKDISPNTWPKWNDEPGYLTAKGSRLAGYMGSFFAAWFMKEQVLPTSCPSDDDLYVISNTVERTLSSAQSFLEKGFPNCEINVHHAGINASNSLFRPIIRNTTATFKEHALKDINELLNTVQLNEAYELLSHILDYQHSRLCEVNNKCNLTQDNHYVSIIPGLKPQISGPLKISNDIVDAFLMQYYEGLPTEDVAWGQLTDLNSWQTVVQLPRAYFNVKYKTRLIARDLSRPLIEYMSEIFFKGDERPKVTLLVGHDVNIHTVFETLLVRPYTLENQIEVIPIGSAVVFQKWGDDETQKDYFKLSFVYQSKEQLRYGNILSLESPPQIKTLELEKCNIDNNGFCSWDDFKIFLSSL